MLKSAGPRIDPCGTPYIFQTRNFRAGETTAPISFLQQDQISQPIDAFDFEKASEPSLFKFDSPKQHVDFWMNPIRASNFLINTIVEGYKIPFFDLPERFVISNRSSALKFKDLLKRPFQG